MSAFIEFNKGMMQMPLHWQAWVMLLLIFNLALPLYYFKHLEAKVVIACLMAGMMLMTVLTAYTGFSRLLGLGHLPWIPLLYFLWKRRQSVPKDKLFGLWLRAVMALNAVSLILDAVDVIRYVAGDR